MAKGIYIGVNAVARKVKKIYIGNGSVARKVKKAYIGVGGVARPFLSSGLEYYGAITPLTDALARTGASNEVYALFCSTGQNDDSIDSYNENLVHSKLGAGLSYSATGGCSGVSFGTYAIFAGGMYDWSEGYYDYSNTANAFHGNLARSAITLSASRYHINAASFEGYALLSGGGSATVEAINTSLVRSNPTPLSYAKSDTTAVRTGDKQHLLFAGSFGNATVDCFNTSLVKTMITNLSKGRGLGAGVTVGNYALIVGGSGGSGGTGKEVDAFDNNLVRTTITSATEYLDRAASLTIGDYALIVRRGSTHVDVYDKYLVKTTKTLGAGDTGLAGATIGSYGIFAGGTVAEAFTT